MKAVPGGTASLFGEKLAKYEQMVLGDKEKAEVKEVRDSLENSL